MSGDKLLRLVNDIQSNSLIEVDFGICNHCQKDYELKEFVRPNGDLVVWLLCDCWKTKENTEGIWRV